MVQITAGDGSGRPDTSGVDPLIAEGYARRMFEAVQFVRFDVCKNLHIELNGDAALYVTALDQYRKLAKERGMNRASERWREYTSD